MKRYGNIFNNICTYENISIAHDKAKRGKSNYSQVQMVEKNRDKYINDLLYMLIDGSYSTSPYRVFKKKDNGKERIIYCLPYFPDRICQWAIMLQVEHVFIRNLIYDTYASIPKRGIHLAHQRILSALSSGENIKYCLKLDVKQFFPSINTEILKDKLSTIFKDKLLLRLLYNIVDSLPVGIPIGNYLSQYFANFYLSELDHNVKEQLKAKNYYRYMDDIVMFHDSKSFLIESLEYIKTILGKVKLEVKSDWAVFDTFKRGLDFVGYRFFDGYTLLRKRTSKRIKSKMKPLLLKDKLSGSESGAVNSYSGWCKFANTHNLQMKYIYPNLHKGIINDHT